MASIKKLQPLLLALLFLCAVGAALWWLWFTVESHGMQLTERIQTIKNEQAFEAQYNELTGMVEATAAERAQLERYILDGEEETIQMLSRLDEIARAQNVELGTSELNVREGNELFDDLVVGFNIVGPEASVMRMIELFETLPYHGSITALSISRAADEQSGGRTVTANISLALTIRNYDQ